MGKNWAIAVGINNYDNLRALKYAKQDAEVMATWFEDETKFDRVFLFTEDSPPINTNPPIPTQPTHARFHRFLNAQFETPLLKPEDNLWFFFAGHGKRYVDQDYLMFLDSDPLAVDRTAISVDYVTQRLRRCGADNVVLLLDACRDEGSRGGLGIGIKEHQGVITFYSCTANQQSWEIDELQHGSFTYTLLEGLRLQGETNCATVERLDHYLRHNIPRLNARYQKPKQNPSLKAEPPYKMYYILLEQAARLRDVEPLKYQASQAENWGNFSLAEQLWIRVLAVSRIDGDAIEAIRRIAQRQSPSPKPAVIYSEPVTSSSGERAVAPLGVPPTPRINRKQFLKWAGFGSAGLITAVVTREISKSQSPTAETISVAEPKYIPPTEGGRIVFGLPLWMVQFETVTVDKNGQVDKRDSNKQAKFFKEDLGNNVTLVMVEIPADSFQMGSPRGEKGHKANEEPQHMVKVPTFFMGRFAVTQEQYQQVMDNNPSEFKEAKHPVHNVSWYDAEAFCEKLRQKTGREYRLPSEAEWEYACRAGTKTPFHFGETITGKLANYNASEIYASEPKGEHLKQTTPVGSFPPNAFGLYDMHGNVREWCADTWHDDYLGAPKDGSAWLKSDGDNKFRSPLAAVPGGSSLLAAARLIAAATTWNAMAPSPTWAFGWCAGWRGFISP